MAKNIKAPLNRKISPARKLDIQVWLVILLCLGTISAMAGAMERTEPSAETDKNVSAAAPAPSSEGIIRFHIIANSDSQEDQALKLEVRNQVLSKIQILLAEEFAREMKASGEENLSEARRLELTRSFITEHLPQIEKWAEETVSAEDFSYPVQGALGVRWIPDREYDGIYFPAGNYEALTLTIGQGAGQNWWCVIYPPLCLIDSSEKMREELGEARFQAWLDSLGGGRIVLKSRIMELLEKN